MKLLEQYIRQLLEYETNATPEKPYGNHMFGLARHKKEQDTAPEKRAYRDLGNYIKNHLDGSDRAVQNLEKSIGNFTGLKDHEKYKDVLVPKPGVVWRGTGVKNLDELKGMYGISPKIVKMIKKHRLGFDPNVLLISEDSKYVPRGKEISSWSYDLDTAQGFAIEHLRDYGSLPIILMAKVPSSGNFIINWEEIPLMHEYEEKEVIAVGPVVCSVFVIMGGFREKTKKEILQLSGETII